MKTDRIRPFVSRRSRPALLGALFALAPSAALAAILTVNSTGDAGDATPGDGLCFTGLFTEISPGVFGPACTLRAGIEEANALAGADTIAFAASLPKVAGFVEISPQSALPAIEDELLIDGYTADGYDLLDPGAVPVVNLSGAQAGANTTGLLVRDGANGSVLRGLAIFSFGGSGIVLTSVAQPSLQYVRIEGCHLGIRRGLFYQGNGRHGIDVRGTDRTRIGTQCGPSGCTGRRNVIAANTLQGIDIASATNTAVQGNRIGTNPGGTATFVPFGGSTANGGWGIRIVSGSRNVIGERYAGAGNLVSGNGAGGILIESAGVNSVRGNAIGTNLAGTQALANAGNGVRVVGGASNDVGGALQGFGNLIAGNASTGIIAEGSTSIERNTIGLTADESAPLPNGWDGIQLEGIGARVEDNVIGGNDRHGILAFGSGHRIVSNRVGTNTAGDDVGNGLHGIVVSATDSVQVGDAGAGNVVGFNDYGIAFSNTAGPNQIQGNFVGTDPFGQPIPNALSGIYVSQSDDLVIGGVDGLSNGLGNVIAGNGGNGLYLTSSGALGTGTRVIGNYIGTNADDDPLGNQAAGILIQGLSNTIGAELGTPTEQVPSHANAIAHNQAEAVRVDETAEQNVIRANVLFDNGDAVPIDLGNDGPTANDVGDVDTGANRRQNSPEFVLAQTQWNEVTGELEVRYRVNTNEGDASYPLTVDFYLRTELAGEAEAWLGEDLYPAASATLYRSVSIPPQPGVLVEGLLIATATDADGNTSELSRQLVPVPEPGSALLLGTGVAALFVRSRGGGIEGRRPRGRSFVVAR